MRFRIKFIFPPRTKRSRRRIIEIETHHDTDIKVSELETIIQTEQFLERLTGLRVHIEESH
jgi:SpoVK/Ycf46/Vps4 family AAA+-type ATPase